MISEYDYPNTDQARERTDAFKDSVSWEKSKHLPKTSGLTTSFWGQLIACTKRQYQILWGEKSTFLIKQVLSCVMALIAGSCFYDSPATSAGLFTKGGAVFFSLLYNCIVAMSEVTESFKGRPVLVKHKSFAMYHPSVFCVAQITADFPVLLFQCSVFAIVMYWMTGLKPTAAAFFTFWAILFTTTLVCDFRSCIRHIQLTKRSVSPHCFEASAPRSIPSSQHRKSPEPLSRESSCMPGT